MLLFLYGPDTYRSGKKLKEIIARYKAIHKSGMSFHVIDAGEDGFGVFYDTAGSVSMFGEKKLVVVKDGCADRGFAEPFLSWQGRDGLASSKDVVCVFHDAKVEKKSPLFEWLSKNVQLEEFETLTGARLINWAKKFTAERGISISQGALFRLSAATAGDLWAFESEVLKLHSYKGGGEITLSDADLFLRPAEETNIFSFVDAVVGGNKSKAVRLMRAHIERGEDAAYLFVMACGQFRNIAQVMHAKGAISGMHPYVVKKSAMQAREFDRERIKKIYSTLVDFDWGIKTGRVEPRAALEELILSL